MDATSDQTKAEEIRSLNGWQGSLTRPMGGVSPGAAGWFPASGRTSGLKLLPAFPHDRMGFASGPRRRGGS